MCTLTFTPKKSGFILTSSRDERANRPTIPPKNYEIKGQNFIYPKDEEKGGSWLVLGEEMVVCLLNGSFTESFLKNKYQESRGNIVLKRFDYETSGLFLEEESFEELPPFTMIIISFKNNLKLEEISWNGRSKSRTEIDHTFPKIWSSSTLYNEDQRAERELWFTEFLQNESEISEEKLLNFHQKQHSTNSAKNILMKREDGKQTTSISQIIKREKNVKFFYKNTLNNTTTSILCETKETDLQLR